MYTIRVISQSNGALLGYWKTSKWSEGSEETLFCPTNCTESSHFSKGDDFSAFYRNQMLIIMFRRIRQRSLPWATWIQTTP